MPIAPTVPGEDRRVVLGWTLVGALFGLTFPLLGIFVASGGTFDVARAHRDQPVMYIVDLAPLVLGFVGMLLGRLYAKLLGTQRAIEHTVRERTRELEDALEELQETHDRLVQAQKMEAIGSLAAGVAHEINTPIQYVGDNLRFLQDCFGDLSTVQQAALELSEAVRAAEVAAEALERFESAVRTADIEFLDEEIPSASGQALEGVQRVSEIVRALKDFSHPGQTEKAPVDLNKTVTNTLTVSRSEWKYVAEVETELDPDLPPVSAISGPLNQALLILIVNAAQALEDRIGDSEDEKGWIRVATSANDTSVVISVADNAGGIPEHVQARVFDPFFTTKEVGKGSGQGLGIARRAIVEQHGGDLRFEVRPGEGTTFMIELPLDGVLEAAA